MAERITKDLLERLAPRDVDYEVRESDGFGVRVRPSGLRSYFLTFDRDGRRRRVTLGRYPEMSPADARAKARAYRPSTAPAALTVGDLARDFVELYAKPRKRSWRDDERIIQARIIPALGRRPAAQVTRREVVAFLDGLVGEGMGAGANRVLAVLRRMFAWAVERAMLENSPCHLVRPPAPETRRDRVLSLDELKVVWCASGADETRAILRLVIVTACRVGEVAGMRRAELDGDWWTIPASRAKNGRAHRVYLTDLAHDILQPWTGDPVLASAVTGMPMHSSSIAHACAKMVRRNKMERFTPHDLRRSAATHMAALGVSRTVVGRVLNHADRGVTAVYDRHRYDAERRHALTLWSDQLTTLLLP